MNKVFQVAKREYVETAKTKIFLISVFFTPLLVGGVLLFTHYMQERIKEGERPPKGIAIIDETRALEEDLLW